MKLHQLRAFQEIMLTGSVSEAARKLNRTQPSVSASIASLENDLEMKLFERRNGRLVAVPEAHYLLSESSELLDRVDTLKRNMRGLKSVTSGHLDMVSMPGPAVFWLPNIIAEFTAEKPDVSCELISRSSDRVYQQITAQQYDLGLADYFQDQIAENKLIKASTFSFNCLCAVHKDTPLAAQDEVTVTDLIERPLATLFPEHEIPRNINACFARHDAKPNIRFRAQYFLPLLTFVERGLACSIVDPLAAASHKLYRGEESSICFRPFTPQVRYRVSVVRPVHKTSSRISETFLKDLELRLEEAGGQRL